MQGSIVSSQTDSAARDTRRLYYLDWLRIIATLGVCLFHVFDIFNTAGFEIKNAEQSEVVTMIQGFFFPWGMPLFFVIAGAGSWFALRRRTAGQFTRERTLRLLVPFFTGTLLLGPIQVYLSWRHRAETGVYAGTLGEFVMDRLSSIGPKLFGAIGYQMWFLGFLFAFSLLALPLFIWFKGEAGRRVIARLAGLCEQRGGILIFILPLVAVRLLLHPFFPLQHDWADFISYGLFFVLGYLVFTDVRFTHAIRRDWPILLGVSLATTLAFGMLILALGSVDLEAPPRALPEFLLWACVAAAGWCGAAFMLFIGMRYLDHDSKALRYGQATLLPFFVLHQTVMLAIAYFVVQWEASIAVKMLVIAAGSIAVTIALIELIIKRVRILRILFGMKGGQTAQTQTVTAPQAIHANSAPVR
jgi:peptidoglycan/LPS O-acetylase OafA/YrhL